MLRAIVGHIWKMAEILWGLFVIYMFLRIIEGAIGGFVI